MPQMGQAQAKTRPNVDYFLLHMAAMLCHMGQNERRTSRATQALAAAIREAQGGADMTTAELARISGVPYSTLRKIRSGDRAIDWEELALLARALGVRASTIAARAEAIEPAS